MSEPNNSIHKEFELERLILFSDAVFAIAITLLVIDLRFPEIPKGISISPAWWLSEMRPLAVQFVSFAISFVFIGLSWARHLRLCRHLKNYNSGVIIRNLFFLFFVVTFPFTITGFTHIRPNFMYPILPYVFNVFMVSLSQYMLTYYILRSKHGLYAPGNEAEKKFILFQSGVFLAIVSFFMIGLSVVLIIFQGNETAFAIVSWTVVLCAIVSKRWVNKHRPPKE